MRDINKLKTRAIIDKAWTMNNSIYQSIPKESQSMNLIQPLDAKYEKAGPRAIVEDDCNKHFCSQEQALLLEILQEFKELFDGTLGDWDCDPVSCKLKEGPMTYNCQPSPYSKNLETTEKEIQRLYDLGVLKLQADSKWACLLL
jgi:hypothetical protein